MAFVNRHQFFSGTNQRSVSVLLKDMLPDSADGPQFNATACKVIFINDDFQCFRTSVMISTLVNPLI